jgi:hypothetical protein
LASPISENTGAPGHSCATARAIASLTCMITSPRAPA